MTSSIAATLTAAALLTSTGAVAEPLLEPAARAFAQAAAEGRPLYELSHAEARGVLATVQADTVPASGPTTTEDLVWTIGPTGAVRIRIVRPAGVEGPLPGLLYYHGGGWVMGDRNTHDHLIRELAVQARAAVVFVEYDNAPEVRYPVNNEQAYAALEHVAANGASLGIDGSRLAVAGDSAGGNMAIAVTLMARERSGPKIAHQLLFYPVTDDVSDNGSYQAFSDGPFLTRRAMDYFLEANYPADRREDVLAFPLRASSGQPAIDCLLESAVHGDITIDLETMTITTDGQVRFAFALKAFQRDCLMKGLDEIDQTLSAEATISTYEAVAARRPEHAPRGIGKAEAISIL